MSRSSGNGHGRDRPEDDPRYRAIRRAASSPEVLAALEKRRREAEQRRQEEADRRARAKEARIKARREKAEKRALAKAQRKLKGKYRDQPPGNGK